MNSEATTVAAGLFHPNTIVALSLDVCVTLILVVIKLVPLGFALVLVARNKAATNLKNCVTAIVALGALYFLFNTEPQALLSLRTFFLVVLCGTFLFRKSFKIDIPKAFVSCLLYAFLSILLDDVTGLLMDKMIPGRITCNRWLAGAVGNHVRLATDNPNLPSSTGFIPAILRASWKPYFDGGLRSLIDALFTPVKVGMKAKEQVTKINAIAVERLALVDSMAGGGTNAGVLTGGANAPAPGTTVETSAPTDSVSIATVTAPPPEAPLATPAAIVPSRVATESLEVLSPRERALWQTAQKKIVVSGIGSSGKNAYAMIGSRMVRPGDTYTVMQEGVAYVFEFRGVGLQGACRWEPVLPGDSSGPVIVAF